MIRADIMRLAICDKIEPLLREICSLVEQGNLGKSQLSFGYRIPSTIGDNLICRFTVKPERKVRRYKKTTGGEPDPAPGGFYTYD